MMGLPVSIIAAAGHGLLASPIGYSPIVPRLDPFDENSAAVRFLLEALASAQKELASLQQRLAEAEKNASRGMSTKKNEQDERKTRLAELVWTMKKELLVIKPLLPIDVETLQGLRGDYPEFKALKQGLGDKSLCTSLNRLVQEDDVEKRKKGKKRDTTLQLAIELVSVLEAKAESTIRDAWKSHAQFVRGRKQPLRSQTPAKKALVAPTDSLAMPTSPSRNRQ